MPEPYYITTAIHYPNGKPHIGHAYETIAADVVARFQRLRGRDVRFQTGTDEHGLKMAQKARDLGVTPRQLADEMSSYFQAIVRPPEHLLRSLLPHHRGCAPPRQPGDLAGDGGATATSISTATKAGTRSATRPIYDESELVDGRGGRKAFAPGHAGRMDGRGELVLPPVEVPGAAARALSRQSRLRPPRDAG